MRFPKELASFFDIFDSLDDPRVERTRLYPMNEIRLATICGVAAGCDGWEDIELFCKQRVEFLRQYLPFTNGVPSDDTFRRFFRAIDPRQFQSFFIKWVQSIIQADDAEQAKHIAIDGKTARGSADGAQAALHLLSAYASESHIILGQTHVAKKTNEITAIPTLIDMLDIRGAIVTIDAMGCQHTIAKRIVQSDGNYVFGVKGNQSTLHQDVIQWFAAPPKDTQLECSEQHDKGHGRIETRKITLCRDVSWLRERHPKWQGINSIVMIESERCIGDKSTYQKRYYISSCSIGAEPMLRAIRSHWRIENNLHWVLDMSFGEDQSRIRKGNAPANIAVIRHAVLNAITSIKPQRTSIKQMRKLAGWDNNTLENVIKALN